MNLPDVITKLVQAQNNFDSTAYANCFTETAVVFDEGKTHNGKTEIKSWIDKANKEYQATMEPLDYSETEHTLKAEVAGNFPGSPAILTYYYEFEDGLIRSLKIV
ncbi:nuclear transport factor 2 family protein [Chryseobacterium salviniae]|uniref:Nuclear transport factor 2 family protein n=1 Tax=Chryseobacterium salviniae TaxID=3101750 RepID=A0ABU6HRT7_9FLAO|nr:nuclear transport factor 2 family protein [Chryseobacterium sp. T9W2-O]MEC3875769.1 nuclear transport factor 2 family protein [Chryseobacterium sp. T9W2-O]